MRPAKTHWAPVILLVGALSFSGCSGLIPDSVRERIRQHDFRAIRRAEADAGKAAPSPIANVLDMPGWTSDHDAATAFARQNGLITIIFFQQAGDRTSERIKEALVSSQAKRLTGNSQTVTLDIATAGQIAARYGITRAPSIIVLNPDGAVFLASSPVRSRSEVMGVLGQVAGLNYAKTG